MKLECNPFDCRQDIVCKCWCTAIWSGCSVRFENWQKPCSRTARRFGSGAQWSQCWMRFRTWDFDPTPFLHLVINTGTWDRIERCAQYCPATASADFHRNFIFTVWSQVPKFSVIYNALKLCWFSNSVSVMRAAPLTCTASSYRASFGPHWQSLTQNRSVFCPAHQTRAGLERDVRPFIWHFHCLRVSKALRYVFCSLTFKFLQVLILKAPPRTESNRRWNYRRSVAFCHLTGQSASSPRRAWTVKNYNSKLKCFESGLSLSSVLFTATTQRSWFQSRRRATQRSVTWVP